jgi:hypothetical protein
MNSELPSESRHETRSLDAGFADKPHLRQRLLEIADMIDALVAQGCTAHEAEAKAIEQIRKLGNGILTAWAERAEAAAVAKAQAADPKLRPYRKKNSDLAFDLRGHLRWRAAPARGPTRSPGEALLPFGSNQTERLFFALAASLDGLRSRRIVFGRDPQSQRALRH